MVLWPHLIIAGSLTGERACHPVASNCYNDRQPPSVPAMRVYDTFQAYKSARDWPGVVYSFPTTTRTSKLWDRAKKVTHGKGVCTSILESLPSSSLPNPSSSLSSLASTSLSSILTSITVPVLSTTSPRLPLNSTYNAACLSAALPVCWEVCLYTICPKSGVLTLSFVWDF